MFQVLPNQIDGTAKGGIAFALAEQTQIPFVLLALWINWWLYVHLKA